MVKTGYGAVGIGNLHAGKGLWDTLYTVDKTKGCVSSLAWKVSSFSVVAPLSSSSCRGTTTSIMPGTFPSPWYLPHHQKARQTPESRNAPTSPRQQRRLHTIEIEPVGPSHETICFWDSQQQPTIKSSNRRIFDKCIGRSCCRQSCEEACLIGDNLQSVKDIEPRGPH